MMLAYLFKETLHVSRTVTHLARSILLCGQEHWHPSEFRVIRRWHTHTRSTNVAALAAALPHLKNLKELDLRCIAHSTQSMSEIHRTQLANAGLCWSPGVGTAACLFSQG
jgi:hypothetical protein